jgi:hypothetical protein
MIWNTKAGPEVEEVTKRKNEKKQIGRGGRII